MRVHVIGDVEGVAGMVTWGQTRDDWWQDWSSFYFQAETGTVVS